MDLTIVVLACVVTWFGIVVVTNNNDATGRSFVAGQLITLFAISGLITIMVAIRLVWNLVGRVVE